MWVGRADGECSPRTARALVAAGLADTIAFGDHAVDGPWAALVWLPCDVCHAQHPPKDRGPLPGRPDLSACLGCRGAAGTP